MDYRGKGRGLVDYKGGEGRGVMDYKGVRVLVLLRVVVGSAFASKMRV